MIFTVMDYTIDTDDERLFELHYENLLHFTWDEFPDADIDDVIYEYDKDNNFACIYFVRNADLRCNYNWIKEDDFRLIIGSDDTQTFLEAMNAIHEENRDACHPIDKHAYGYYIKKSKVKKYFMDHFVESGVKSVDFFCDNTLLCIMLFGQ